MSDAHRGEQGRHGLGGQPNPLLRCASSRDGDREAVRVINPVESGQFTRSCRHGHSVHSRHRILPTRICFTLRILYAAYTINAVPTRGRRRDPAIDAAILAATRDLLLEVGYANLSMEAVAARARITKPTLYLRYPTRAVLVFEAIFGKTKVREIPDTGSIRTDLDEAYRWAVDEFTAPEARAAIPGLLAEIAANPKLAQLIRAVVIGPEYGRVRQQLELAQTRGEIRADVDLDLVIDAFIGTALARITLLNHAVDYAYGTRLVDLLLDGVAHR
jgi:AcrR family transcriptional regulator